MAIPVIFSNSTAGMIEIYRLDDLISQGKIIAYKNSGNWIRVEVNAEKEIVNPEFKPASEEKIVRIYEKNPLHSPGKPSKEDKEMLISVIYKNNRRGMIDEYLLDDLIREDKIKAFRRSGGWAKIGRDPVREKWKQSGYNGLERRKRELPPDYFL
jgi:antitoxin component YwqK of YwqJK toxin-antitoxin module